MTEENGSELTGVSDEHYNLVSTLYHALESASTYEIYVEDAEEAGDNELADCLREIQEQNRDQAQRAKELLKARLK